MTEKGIQYQIEGAGDTVTDQIPRAGSKLIKESGKLILYTGESTPSKTVTVPNVIGMSPTVANRTIINAGLNINISGAVSSPSATGAIAISQSIAGGENVEYGTVVEVEFRYVDGMADG